MQFKIETFLNQYLSPGATRADAVFSLSASGAAPARAVHRVVGLIADRSGSMAGPKMEALKHALRVAVDQMDADTEAFVLSFEVTPHLVVGPVRMDEAGRRAAHQAIQRMEAGGGTVMSRALLEAKRVFQTRPGAVCQAIMLTDGQNDTTDEDVLQAALRECAGSFQADCRGVGTDWSPAQLRAIASALLGTAQLVADPAGMAQDFHDTLAAALGKSVADVRLRLWMPKNSRLVSVKQAFPAEIDLTSRLIPVDQRAVDVPLGAWGEGTQDYFAHFEVTPLAVGEQMLVCRPSIMTGIVPGNASGGEAVPGGNVTVSWTADAGLTARIDAQVAHYSGQAEKAQAIQEGLEALGRHDEATATLHLGRALHLAEQSGDAETTRRLRQVVEGDAGTLRIRQGAAKVAVMDLDVGSTRTVRAKRD